LNGGRWNSEGIAVVYLSSTLSLAALEYLVHVDVEDAPHDLVALEVDLPDEASIQNVDAAELPIGWLAVSDHPACVELGDAWVKSGASLLLRVPSAIISAESNFLLNPAHPESATVQIRSAEPFSFDKRLLA
jgi:RES domain-containing protein